VFAKTPLGRKGFPWNSSYAYAEGDVIRCIDLDGGEKYVVTGTIWKGSDGKWLTNITTQTLNKPGPLGSGTLYNIKIDNYKYTDKGRKGNQFNAMAYIPSAEEQITKPKERSKWNKFWDGVLDGGASDKGSGGGNHQTFGIIITTKDDGMGSTKTGTGDNADFYDVIDNGLLGLLGGTGGQLSVSGLAEEAKRKVSKLVKGIDELSSGTESGVDSYEKTIEELVSSNSPSTTPANTPASTKPAAIEKTKTVIQENKPKSLPKISKDPGTQVAIYGRKDSIGKDGSIWDVPTLTPVKNNSTKKKAN